MAIPKNEFRWDVDLTHKEFTFGYRMRYIGKMCTSAYENFNELETACTHGRLSAAQRSMRSRSGNIRRSFYHDIRFEWNLNREFQFYMGIDNVLDTHPPFGLSGTGTIGTGGDRGTGTAAIYDAFGRKVYAGFRARF